MDTTTTTTSTTATTPTPTPTSSFPQLDSSMNGMPQSATDAADQFLLQYYPHSSKHNFNSKSSSLCSPIDSPCGDASSSEHHQQQHSATFGMQQGLNLNLGEDSPFFSMHPPHHDPSNQLLVSDTSFLDNKTYFVQSELCSPYTPIQPQPSESDSPFCLPLPPVTHSVPVTPLNTTPSLTFPITPLSKKPRYSYNNNKKNALGLSNTKSSKSSSSLPPPPPPPILPIADTMPPPPTLSFMDDSLISSFSYGPEEMGMSMGMGLNMNMDTNMNMGMNMGMGIGMDIDMGMNLFSDLPIFDNGALVSNAGEKSGLGSGSSLLLGEPIWQTDGSTGTVAAGTSTGTSSLTYNRQKSLYNNNSNTLDLNLDLNPNQQQRHQQPSTTSISSSLLSSSEFVYPSPSPTPTSTPTPNSSLALKASERQFPPPFSFPIPDSMFLPHLPPVSPSFGKSTTIPTLSELESDSESKENMISIAYKHKRGTLRLRSSSPSNNNNYDSKNNLFVKTEFPNSPLPTLPLLLSNRLNTTTTTNTIHPDSVLHPSSSSSSAFPFKSHPHSHYHPYASSKTSRDRASNIRNGIKYKNTADGGDGGEGLVSGLRGDEYVRVTKDPSPDSYCKFGYRVLLWYKTDSGSSNENGNDNGNGNGNGNSLTNGGGYKVVAKWACHSCQTITGRKPDLHRHYKTCVTREKFYCEDVIQNDGTTWPGCSMQFSRRDACHRHLKKRLTEGRCSKSKPRQSLCRSVEEYEKKVRDYEDMVRNWERRKALGAEEKNRLARCALRQIKVDMF